MAKLFNTRFQEMTRHAESIYATELPEFSLGIELGAQSDGRALFQLNGDRFRHTAIMGTTGSGKSNHMMQLERQDIQSGAGVIVVAAHEEDALYALRCIPPQREDEVVAVDFGNRHFLPCLNPLDVNEENAAEKSRAVNDAIELLTSNSEYRWAGPRFEEMARMALFLVLDSPRVEDRCLHEAKRCFMEPNHVRRLLDTCNRREVYDFWTKEYPPLAKSTEHGDLVSWVAAKFADFDSDFTLKSLFGPGRKTVDLGRIVQNGRIAVLLVPEARIGAAAATRIRLWIAQQLRNAAMSRGTDTAADDYFGAFGNLREPDLSPVFVYIDEFEKMADNSFAPLLAESRKRHVGFVLSFQNLGQLHTYDHKVGHTSSKMLEAVLGNVGTFVVYPVGAHDKNLIAQQIGATARQVERIERYHPLASLCMDNAKGAPQVLAVPPKPDADDPGAPARIAERMIAEKTWLPCGDDEARYQERLLRVRRHPS